MWDGKAAAFDDQPDHGLVDPEIRAAWRNLLFEVLPAAPARVADLGCGTGTLTRLLSDEGYTVDGLDISPQMVRRARVKAPTSSIQVGDASDPRLEPGAYDVVLSRHVLWALLDPESAFARWVRLLRPGGVVVLIEGRWGTGAGLSSADAERIVRASRDHVEVRPMTEAAYWGKTVHDERYLLISIA